MRPEMPNSEGPASWYKFHRSHVSLLSNLLHFFYKSFRSPQAAILADHYNKIPADHIHKTQILPLEKNFQNIPGIHASSRDLHAATKFLSADYYQIVLSKLWILQPGF